MASAYKIGVEKVNRTHHYKVWPCEVSAVFQCTQVNDAGLTKAAICKIYLQ